MKDSSEKVPKPFGVEYLEELPPYTPGIFGAGSPPTSLCTGLQTGGGDDPLKESVCDPPPKPCWIAAVVFEEDFFTGPRVNLVRRWLTNDWGKSGPVAKLVINLYREYGERAARMIKRNGILKRAFRKLFERALSNAEAKYGRA